MQKITPCLWFNDQAEEAVNFYRSIFKISEILKISRYGEGAPFEKGTVLTISFTINGQEFLALNGGPIYNFTPAISFIINCINQAEIDEYWDKLSEGGQEVQCGWLTDKYGVSWQIVPTELGDLLNDEDAAKSHRAMMAMLQMIKIDIDKLRNA
ncbi:MAG: VOC family protein [Candidatus Kapabacteria bacterium]|nr:VOC family protein [Candidatus Kapabacteria bacterium]